MQSKKKREVKVFLCELSAYQLEGDVEKIAPIFTNTLEWFKMNIGTLYKTNPSLYDSCHRFELEHNIGWNDESDSYDLLGWRWETDEELQKRVETARKQSIAKKEADKKRAEATMLKELEELKRLKEKYE